MKKLKHVVITGAGSGLGASLAKKYIQKGYHVTLLGRTMKKLEDLASSFEESHFSIYALDVASYEDVRSIFKKIKKNQGHIDILVNNAGVGYFELAENLDLFQMDQMIDINLKGTIYCTQQVIKDMKDRNKGSVINIVSTAGVEGKVTESVYCASKFGVKGYTESLLKEVADTNVHIHGIYMGGMNTPFWDGILDEDSMDGMMDPDDIADIVIGNTMERKNINVPEVIINNH